MRPSRLEIRHVVARAVSAVLAGREQDERVLVVRNDRWRRDGGFLVAARGLEDLFGHDVILERLLVIADVFIRLNRVRTEQLEVVCARTGEPSVKRATGRRRRARAVSREIPVVQEVVDARIGTVPSSQRRRRGTCQQGVRQVVEYWEPERIGHDRLLVRLRRDGDLLAAQELRLISVIDNIKFEEYAAAYRTGALDPGGPILEVNGVAGLESVGNVGKQLDLDLSVDAPSPLDSTYDDLGLGWRRFALEAGVGGGFHGNRDIVRRMRI